MPRIRLTIGRMMLAIAVLVGGLWWAIARPYPEIWFYSATCYVWWSDGSNSACDGPRVIAFRGNSWFRIVDWPDGRTGYYLIVGRSVAMSGAGLETPEERTRR